MVDHTHTSPIKSSSRSSSKASTIMRTCVPSNPKSCFLNCLSSQSKCSSTLIVSGNQEGFSLLNGEADRIIVYPCFSRQCKMSRVSLTNCIKFLNITKSIITLFDEYHKDITDANYFQYIGTSRIFKQHRSNGTEYLYINIVAFSLQLRNYFPYIRTILLYLRVTASDLKIVISYRNILNSYAEKSCVAIYEL